MCAHRYRLIVATIALMLGAATCLVRPTTAQNPAPGKPPVGRQSRAAATPKRSPRLGDVDVERSRAYVLIGATGLGHEHGAEGRLASGEIRLGADSSAGKLVFEMRSFVAETAASRKYVGLEGEVAQSTARKVTDNMLGHDVLNVAQFPTAEFVIRSALPMPPQKKNGKAEAQFVLEGDFTLHGVTHPLKVTAVATTEADGIRLRGRFTVLQTDFGVTPYSKALGAVGVTDELVIWGDFWLHNDAVGRS